MPLTQSSQAEIEQYYLNNKPARQFVLLVICLGSMLAPFALTSVNLALPTIALALNANAVLVSWMPTGFMMTSVMSMLPMGKLADRYGRKRFYFFGVLLTALLSLLASFGQSMEWILACRLLQGVSMSMMFVSGMAIVTLVYPQAERGYAIGMYTASLYFAVTLSPFLGGWVTEAFGWRAVFWILALPALVVILMLKAVKGEWVDPVEKPFDWTGSVIFAVWIGTFVYGLSGLPKLNSIVTLLISILYFYLFIYHQRRVKHPLVDLGMFRHNRLFSFSLLASILIYGASYPLGFLLSLFLQLALDYSAFGAGRVILIPALVMAVIAPFAGKLSDRFDPSRISSLGCVIVALGFVLMTFVTSTSDSVLMVSIGLALMGLGVGLFSTPNINAALKSVPKSKVGVASASINLARMLGNMLGMTLVSLLIYNLIGANEFTNDQTQEITATFWIWACFAFVLAIFSLILSLLREKVAKPVGK